MNWKQRFAWHYLKENTLKNTILWLSSLISFSSLLLSLGFFVGSNQLIDNTQDNLLDSQLFMVTKQEKISSSESPVALVKTLRPNLEELNFLSTLAPSAIIANDYQKIFPGDCELKLDSHSIENVVFTPLHSFQQLHSKKHLLVNGAIPKSENLAKIVINSTFAEILTTNVDSLIGKKIEASITSKIIVADSIGSPIEDYFLLQEQLEICAVFDELSFLNSPKIFYSFVALEKRLDEYALYNISKSLHRFISCREIYQIIGNDHYLTNYSRTLFVLDNNDFRNLSSLAVKSAIEDSPLSIESNALVIKDTYRDLTKAALYSMLIFVIIAFAGLCAIMAISAYSNYVSKKRESALLSCLGADKSAILNIFLRQNLSITISAAIASLFFSKLIQGIANLYFYEHFMFDGLIDIPFFSYRDIPMAIIIVLIIFAFITTSIFTLIPLSFYKGFSLADELRDGTS
ncbi:MAG: FtsX-like permease family protein [Bacilli bacterium]|jgi:hypothetical protein